MSENKTLAIKLRGELRQIIGNSILKTIAFTFLKNRTDPIAEARPKNNGDHFRGEIVTVFGVHHTSGCMASFF